MTLLEIIAFVLYVAIVFGYAKIQQIKQDNATRESRLIQRRVRDYTSW